MPDGTLGSRSGSKPRGPEERVVSSLEMTVSQGLWYIVKAEMSMS